MNSVNSVGSVGSVKSVGNSVGKSIGNSVEKSVGKSVGWALGVVFLVYATGLGVYGLGRIGPQEIPRGVEIREIEQGVDGGRLQRPPG